MLALFMATVCQADDLTNRLRSHIEGRLAQNPVMIREQELYKLAEANFMLKLADKVEKGEISQETFDLALGYLELWSAKR